MKQPEIEQEIIDMLGMAFPTDEAPTPGSTLDDLGLDSLDAVQVQLMFEDRWGEGLLHDYRPDEKVKLSDMAAEIARRIA